MRQAGGGYPCAHCGVGCGLTPHLQDNEIVKVGYQHVQNRD
ncbi:hypothetical protein ACFXKY_42880 [Streptomyces canus]